VLSPRELSLTNGTNGSSPAITASANTSKEALPATEAVPEDRTPES
jgi:cell division protease FtsH